MDFTMPEGILKTKERFKIFLKKNLTPHISSWYQEGAIPRGFFMAMGQEGWLSYDAEKNGLTRRPYLETVMVMEELGAISPGVAIAVLVQADLGTAGLCFFGSDDLKKKYGRSVARGEILLCIGNTENVAGSDVANIAMDAKKVDGGWRLSGSKAYVTNGLISDMALVTAVSDPAAERNRRLSMFLVDLSGEGIRRRKLNKQVWIPSDLTRITLKNVFVPNDHLIGERGRGLQQVLSLFTHSRVPISALTLGTATGALETAIRHGEKRELFGQKIWDFQAKAFEAADHYASIEAARLLLMRACWAMEHQDDFRLDASLAKYMAVKTTRNVTAWAADLFGASGVIFDHPSHKCPMDAWASSIGEGTQDVQKLVIFREFMKRRASKKS